MTSQHHSFLTAERGAGDERVAESVHGQVRQRRQGALDRVGQRFLLAADGSDVGERGGQRRAVCGQVELVVHEVTP
jgi:hypothetical protein